MLHQLFYERKTYYYLGAFALLMILFMIVIENSKVDAGQYYYSALSAPDKKQAEGLLKRVIDLEEGSWFKSNYRDLARMKLAHSMHSEGRISEAIEQYHQVIGKTKNSAIKEIAAYKLLIVERQNSSLRENSYIEYYLSRSLVLPSSWQQLKAFTLIEEGDFEAAVDLLSNLTDATVSAKHTAKQLISIYSKKKYDNKLSIE